MIGPSPGLAGHEQRWMSSAAHWRSSDVADGAGGVVRTWAQLGAVDVVYGIPGPAERATAEQEGVEYDYSLKVPADADVQRGDRLVVDGQTIEVTSSPTSSAAHLQLLRGRVEPWDEPNS